MIIEWLLGFVAVGLLICLWALSGPRLFPKRVQTGGAGPTTDESNGGIMAWIARRVVLGLGHLTYGALHVFEKLGVDVTQIDDQLARLNRNVSVKLSAAADAVAKAQAEVQRVKDEDAAEDAVQISTAVDAALKEAADKIKEAADAVGDPEAGDPTTEPTTPVDETPVVPAPEGEPVTPPAPFDPAPADPEAPVAEDGTGPVDPTEGDTSTRLA